MKRVGILLRQLADIIDSDAHNEADVGVHVYLVGEHGSGQKLGVVPVESSKASQGQVQDHGEAEAQGGATLDVVAQAVGRAWHWMTGGGETSEEEVQKVQGEVEKKGGRIVSNSDGAALINYVGCDLEKWDEIVENLAEQLDLDKKNKAGLSNAQYLDQGEHAHFRDVMDHGVRKTTYIAWRTVRDEAHQKIHVIYGQHQLSMETLESGTAFPIGNCIKFGDRTFTVLPAASPHTHGCGREMVDQWFEVPSGWRVCDAAANNWSEVVKNVIRPYYWNVDEIVAKQGEKFPAWWCASESNAGKQSRNNTGFLEYDPDQQRFRFTNFARLLIEKMPHSSFELDQEWKRFVRLSAQAEWSRRLAPVAPVPVEES